VQPPPGVSSISPSENYWNQLDAQGARNGIIVYIPLYIKLMNCVSAINMVNGISVNGLGEVSMDTTQAVINNSLIANNLIALGECVHIEYSDGI
jgi:type I protein arginine methyltransferase